MLGFPNRPCPHTCMTARGGDDPYRAERSLRLHSRQLAFADLVGQIRGRCEYIRRCAAHSGRSCRAHKLREVRSVIYTRDYADMAGADRMIDVARQLRSPPDESHAWKLEAHERV